MPVSARWKEQGQFLRLAALNVLGRIRHWPALRALPSARSLRRDWSGVAVRHSPGDKGLPEPVVAAIRRIAVHSAIQQKWIVRAMLSTGGGLLVAAGVIGMPFLAASLLDVEISIVIAIGASFLALTLWAVVTRAFLAAARVPPLSVVPLPADVLEFGVLGVLTWWMIRGGGNEQLSAFLGEGGLNLDQDDRARVTALVHTLLLTAALYGLTTTLVDFVHRISGYRSPAELLARRAHGYLPPAHIIMEVYLHLIVFLDGNRARIRKSGVKRRLVSAMRFNRAEMVLDVDRCVRSYGGGNEDRGIYRDRAQVFASRLELHERRVFDAMTPAQVDSVLREMLLDVESLCVDGWPDASGQGRRSVRTRLVEVLRRVVPALALGALGFFYPKLPTIDAGAPATGAVQAAIITAAVALLVTSDANSEGRARNLLERRGRDQGES
ncbi:hypothetical protein AB0883_24700 [Micromonospora sp. NPDC047812]|uniref:hypothetical protein n=1 Tax=Micromonospora sp. NPDC047812 TaxID=3155742 RepID=UPI003454E441